MQHNMSAICNEAESKNIRSQLIMLTTIRLMLLNISWKE